MMNPLYLFSRKKEAPPKLVFFFSLFFFFILPTLLFIFNIIPKEKSFIPLLIIAILIVYDTKQQKMSAKDLGLKRTITRTEFSLYAFLTIFLIGAIIVLSWFFKKPTQVLYENSHFYGYFLISSFLQEFIFRGWLLQKTKIIFNKPLIIITFNTILFGFIHIIFPAPLMMFVLTSIMGALFTGLYLKYPHLLLATIVHALVNFFAVYHCFVSLSKYC